MKSNVRNPAKNESGSENNKDYPDNNVKDFTDCPEYLVNCMTQPVPWMLIPFLRHSPVMLAFRTFLSFVNQLMLMEL